MGEIDRTGRQIRGWLPYPLPVPKKLIHFGSRVAMFSSSSLENGVVFYAHAELAGRMYGNGQAVLDPDSIRTLAQKSAKLKRGGGNVKPLMVSQLILIDRHPRPGEKSSHQNSSKTTLEESYCVRQFVEGADKPGREVMVAITQHKAIDYRTADMYGR